MLANQKNAKVFYCLVRQLDTNPSLIHVKSVNKLLFAKVGVAYLDVGSFWQTVIKLTACHIQDGRIDVPDRWLLSVYFPKDVDQWLSRILEWFVSSCVSDEIAVVENWYDVELAIWVHAALCDLVAVEMSYLRTYCRSVTSTRK